MSRLLLRDGPLDGAVRDVTVGDGENPPEVMEFDHEADGGTWYAEYRRMGQDDAGWHYGATGNAERADEE